MKCARYGLIAILLSIIVLPLSAMAAPLDGPIPIMQDGLLFSNFSPELFTINPDPLNPIATPRNLSEIDVSGITVNGESGLRIASPFSAPGFAGQGSGTVLLLAFDVMALNPHQPIHSVTLTVPELFLTGAASGVMAFSSAGPVSVSATGMSAGAPGCPCPVEGPISATAALASDMRRLHIDSMFTVASDSLAGAASAGGFDVTFVQSVPEPSIVLLLVFGAGLIAAIAQRTRRT